MNDRQMNLPGSPGYRSRCYLLCSLLMDTQALTLLFALDHNSGRASPYLRDFRVTVAATRTSCCKSANLSYHKVCTGCMYACMYADLFIWRHTHCRTKSRAFGCRKVIELHNLHMDCTRIFLSGSFILLSPWVRNGKNYPCLNKNVMWKFLAIDLSWRVNMHLYFCLYMLLFS